MGLGIYCKDCRANLKSRHFPDCSLALDSPVVENEHCGEPIVWEPQSEVEDSPADPGRLELHLSDHLHLGEKE